MLSRLGLVYGAALALLVPATAAPAATITTAGTLAHPASSLTAGPDGNLWHTAPSRVGRTTLTGATRELALPGKKARPGAIVLGPDNALWFSDASGAVDRVTPLGLLAEVTKIDGRPGGLTVGADLNVWVAISGSKKQRAIGRITPAGVLTTFTAGLTGAPADITPGWDGALWFTEPAANLVGRITTDGVITEFPAPKAPAAIATGPDAAVWFTSAAGVSRMGLTGAVQTVKVSQAGDIALGADNALWFTRRKSIGRVTAQGALSDYPTAELRPRALALGWDGAMWFTDARKPVLGRITLVRPVAPVATPPVLGHTFTAKPQRGRVKVKSPGAKRFSVLDAGQSLPVGSVIDATAGRVAVRSATDRAGHTQRVTLYGGRFAVRQARRPGGLTKIVLRGEISCGEVSIARRRRHRRRLWAADSGGAFATLGLNSVTTVRGTKWLTEDRCGGTLTRVVRGSVVVRERATGRRFVLHAGQRHFARRRG